MSDETDELHRRLADAHRLVRRALAHMDDRGKADFAASVLDQGWGERVEMVVALGGHVDELTDAIRRETEWTQRETEWLLIVESYHRTAEEPS